MGKEAGQRLAWNEGQPPRQRKKMMASAAGEDVVLAKIEDGMAALADGLNQTLVSQCLLVVSRDSLRKNQEEEQVKKLGSRMKTSRLLPLRVREKVKTIKTSGSTDSSTNTMKCPTPFLTLFSSLLPPFWLFCASFYNM